MRRSGLIEETPSALLLKESCIEDPHEYKLCLGLTPEKLETSFYLISDRIQRPGKIIRDAMRAQIKLKVTLNFLAKHSSIYKGV